MILWAGLLTAATGALAQAPASAVGAAPARDDASLGRHSQRVERLQFEDAGNRVDEVRAGGQTQSITVHPKAPVPAYDVRPADPSRATPSEAGPGSAGPRTWKILQF